MITLQRVSAVLVPFELVGENWIKRDDLPRFTKTKDVIDYLTSHPGISYRKDEAGRRVPVRVDWIEHSEPDLIKEYVNGVGTAAFNRSQSKRRS